MKVLIATLVLVLVIGCESTTTGTPPEAKNKPEVDILKVIPLQLRDDNSSLYWKYRMAPENPRLAFDMGMLKDPAILNWELEGFEAEPEKIISGTGTFKGRKIPGAIGYGVMKVINRKEGMRRSDPVIVAALDDKEFGMWRGVKVWLSKEEAEKGIPVWRNEMGFSQNN